MTKSALKVLGVQARVSFYPLSEVLEAPPAHQYNRYNRVGETSRMPGRGSTRPSMRRALRLQWALGVHTHITIALQDIYSKDGRQTRTQAGSGVG